MNKNNLLLLFKESSQVKIETFGISHKCFREVSSEVYEISHLKHLRDISIETFMRYQLHYINYNK